MFVASALLRSTPVLDYHITLIILRVQSWWRTTVWLLWCIFLAVYLAALAQFYSAGLHLLPGDAFTYAGDPVGNPRPSYLPVAPTPEQGYGTSEWASLALSSLTYGCLSLPVLGLLFVVVLTRWRTYSLLGKGLRIAVVLLTITALVFG